MFKEYFMKPENIQQFKKMSCMSLVYLLLNKNLTFSKCANSIIFVRGSDWLGVIPLPSSPFYLALYYALQTLVNKTTYDSLIVNSLVSQTNFINVMV